MKTGSSPETHQQCGCGLSCSAPVHQEGALSTSAAGVRSHTEGSFTACSEPEAVSCSSKSRPCRLLHHAVDTVEVTGAAGRASEAQDGEAPLSSCLTCARWRSAVHWESPGQPRVLSCE